MRLLLPTILCVATPLLVKVAGAVNEAASAGIHAAI